ncbi:hypothetical protein AAFA46_00840 [Oscillospiraceae bacterium WX1]
MDRRLFEVLLSGNNYVFGFAGFEESEDFSKIMKIIEEEIRPNRCNGGGLEDKLGYFDKDGFRVEVEFNSIMGNFLVYQGQRSDENLAKIREWAKIIFDNLMLGIGNK